jgi:hypothetical protein
MDWRKRLGVLFFLILLACVIGLAVQVTPAVRTYTVPDREEEQKDELLGYAYENHSGQYKPLRAKPLLMDVSGNVIRTDFMY